MKKIYITGNWKSNNTVSQAKAWFEGFAEIYKKNPYPDFIKVIIFGPFTALYEMKQVRDANSLPIELGAQDISPFPPGAFTGEENGQMLKELVEWVVLGHSERRKLLNEDDYELGFEVQQAKQSGLSVIYCVPDDQTHVSADADIIGYEPIWAIGTGKTDSPDNANSVIAGIKAKSGVDRAVYGGSVVADNVSSFVHQPAIDGVLVGGASLDPVKFADLIAKAAIE